jgi:hypothetical protein
LDIDPMEYVAAEEELNEKEEKDKEHSKSRLNTWVAVTVAILATFMGLCKVKDDNIVQQMQQDQAKSVDTWAWYQAKKTRIVAAQGTIDQLELAAISAPAVSKAGYEKKIGDYKKYIDKEQKDLKDVQDKAKGYDDDYDRWNFHDDQFDLSDAMLAMSIALLAVTSLTQKKWLFVLAMVPTFVGVLMGLSGLFGWHIHSNLAAKWLGT